MLIAWRATGKVPEIELSEFRNRLGVGDNEYTAMNNFKSRVLEPAIKQINEHTDITVKVEQHKKGALLAAFHLSLSKSNSRKLKNRKTSSEIQTHLTFLSK